LLERAIALDHVDEVIDDTSLASHDEIEIAQANIEIDDGDTLVAARESRGDAGGSGRLANAPFTRGDDDDLGQC
jgi:hypothetical protein